MKICSTHWMALKTACSERGMDHLVHHEVDFKELDERRDFDPMLKATWMVMGRGLELGGLGMLTTDEMGNQYCPICEAVKHSVPDANFSSPEKHWTEGVMDAILEEARQLGLMPKPS